MNYPLISEYIDAIKSAKDNFEELSYLLPVMGDDDLPVMTSGNFAVVFKMKDERDGKFYAVKCFTKEQDGRAEAYRQITEELKDVSSPYLTSVRYLDKELFVDIGGPMSLFPVLLMEWVDGITLDKFILQNLDNTKLLHKMAYKFSRMAKWLLSQRFAHGDLKPDNILITKDLQIVLVDYDGMYVPSMKGQKAKELGSPNFRHPNRTIDNFDEQIDDFPIVIILLSLKAVSLKPNLFAHLITGDRMLFEERDYLSLENNKILPLLNQVLYDKELIALLGAFFILLQSHDFPRSISSIIDIRQSIEDETRTYSEKQAKEIIEYFYKSITLYPPKIVYLLPDLFNIEDYRKLWLPNRFLYKYSLRSVWWDEKVHRSKYGWAPDYDSVQYSVIGEFSKKSRPDLIKMNHVVFFKEWDYLVDYTYEILSELGVVDYFVEKVPALIDAVNKNNSYDYKKEDFAF